MALCASGEMSLAGSVVGRSVACELGCSGTGTISMDRADVRALAGRPGAGCAICMCDFYGKSSAPPLGASFCGGYYLGSVSSPANYYLVVSPKSNDISNCQWKVTLSASPNTCSETNGYLNTYAGLTCSSVHPAGWYTSFITVNGYSDWYMPARDELSVLYFNKNCLPVNQTFNLSEYYSSTEYSANCVWSRNMNSGPSAITIKTSYTTRTRPIRRQPF